MSDTSESDDGPGKWTRSRRGGSGKNSRKIVMRIEFDDSDDTSSGSESQDSEGPRAIGRRLRGGGKRLISSDDEDSSSGSDVVRTVVRRGGSKRKAVIADDEPAAVDEPHTSAAAMQHNNEASSGASPAARSTAVVALEDGFASDSSNDDLEKCPICLLSLRNQEIGKPSVCDHLFCAICIEEWSRNVRTCPIDRQAFDSIIVQRSINCREFVREIRVEEGGQKDDFEEEGEEFFDISEETPELEHCRICSRPDREDVMLLCDGCNHGYHMDCLSTPLTEIPEGFWYCDNCFASEEEDLQEDLNVLYAEVREMGIPETRLRVREVRQPRIPRTRQSERIRASIMARTRRSNTRITSEMDLAQPTTSVAVSTSSRSAPVGRRRQTRKRPGRRRARRQRRTYVVEYDVDNFDQKFQIKTTKKVIKKRKRSKRFVRRAVRRTGNATGSRRRNVEMQEYLAQRAAQESGSAISQPRFSLFGTSNDLAYFSDDSDNSIIGGDSETGRGSGGGASIETSIRIHSFASGRSHSRRKALIRDLEQPRQVDVLSSILDMQDRFHNATRQNHISQVTIGPDGTLSLPANEETNRRSKVKSDSKESQNVSPSDINQAPMYPRGGGSNYSNSGGGGGYNNRFNNQSNYRNSTGGGGGGQFRGGHAGGGTNGGNAGGFLFNAFRRDNNNSQSDGFQPNRPHNTDNSTPNRGRFRQNQNQNQNRRNQNNQNRYSGPPNLGGSNDMFVRNFNEPPSNTFNDSSSSSSSTNTLLPRPTGLFNLGSLSLFSTPTKTNTSADTSGPGVNNSASFPRSGNNTTPFSGGGNNSATPFSGGGNNSATPFSGGNNNATPFSSSNTNNLISLSVPPPLHPPPAFGPLNQPPPVFGPMNLSSQPDRPANDEINQRNWINNEQVVSSSNVIPTISPLVPPPLWNSNLFRKIGETNDQQQNNSIKPIEQQQVAIAPFSASPVLSSVGPLAPVVQPLAPPPWNQNLFRLTSDYADSNDDDDDSDCPNFSVYSAESFQVARSSENALDTNKPSADSTENNTTDNMESVRQEDDFEEKEEDLVQLGDDDEIPDGLGKKITDSNDENANQDKMPESEIYEPEFPTVEPNEYEEEDEKEAEAKNEKVAEDGDEKDTEDSEEECDTNVEKVEENTAQVVQTANENNTSVQNIQKDEIKGDTSDEDENLTNKTTIAKDDDLQEDRQDVSGKVANEISNDDNEKPQQSSADSPIGPENLTSAKTDETVKNTENAKSVPKSSVKLSVKRRVLPRNRSNLDLYDDSDWEEWNIAKAELIPMPVGPAPPNNVDIPINDSSSPEEGEICGADEPLVKSDELETERFTPDNDPGDGIEKFDSIATAKSCRTPDEEGGTPEIDDAKLRQLTAQKGDELTDEEEEPERSYTPCLDEKTEHEVAHCEKELLENEKLDDDNPADKSTSVVDGMEMEMISDEDEHLMNCENAKAHAAGTNKSDDKNKKGESSGKRTKRETFKKVSKSTKERNYRDKERGFRNRRRGRSRSPRSRTGSKGKENRNRQRPPLRRVRRKEIERYNVRNVIGQPRTYKDRYGRDTSRPRTRSKSRSRSFRRLRTRTQSRSISPRNDRRSFSMSPTPVSRGRPSPRRISPRRISPRRVSPPVRRPSPRRRRVFTPKRSKSRSRSRRRSRSIRRSSLPRRRSRSPPLRRSRTPPISIERPASRRKRQMRKRNASFSCSRSCSQSHSKIVSRSRSPLPKSPRRSDSKSPARIKKTKRLKDQKKKRIKKRMLSLSPSPPAAPNIEHSPERQPAAGRKKKKRLRSKSPIMQQDRWSPSPDPVEASLPIQNNELSWTPPLAGAENDNLTVILKNKEAALNNKKKRDKKKKNEKRRENNRKEKRRQRSEMRESPVAPSKEVFASGNNILVSVSFNKDNNAGPPQQTTVVTLPPTREEIVSKRRSAERQSRKQKKPKEKAQKRRKKLDTKPVAIIDLDRSPFQVIAQSPRDIIVLTDESDREPDDEENNKRIASNAITEMNANDRTATEMQMNDMDKSIDMQRPSVMEEDPFEMQQMGPKTPPDPPSNVKFSLVGKAKQLKARNPLHDEQEELEEPTESNHPDESATMHNNANKIGPNTPPESGPCSPDAYDPFDPTKSPSMSPAHSPEQSQEHTLEDDEADSISHDREPSPVEPRSTTIPQDKTMNPVELVMALINTKTALSQQEILNLNETGAYTVPPLKPDGTEVMNKTTGDENNASAGNKAITVLSSVLISSGKSQALPMPQTQSSILRQNGGTGLSNQESGFEAESPYSPGSGDYEDLFEPPGQGTDGSISLAQLAHNRKTNKADMFDNLFGSASPAEQVRMPSFGRRKGKMSKRSKGKAKTEDDQGKMFDELPNSAVDLQVKDKFLRKLNRQERVVEEVKLVLKPHYNKKRISKEDYKEIMRRSVPKICHSRSGEINPAKIKNLIEAYVKKFRQRNKLNIIGTGQVSSAVKCAAYLKKL